MKPAHLVFQSYWVVPLTWQSFIGNGEMACITSAWSSRKLSLNSLFFHTWNTVHLFYLVILSSGLCNKLELTNQFAIRTLRFAIRTRKSTPYRELLKIVNIKSLEHRRYMQALILLYKSLFITGAKLQQGIVLTAF